MSAASGTLFTFGGSLLRGAGSLAEPGNAIGLEINIGLLGVAVQVSGTYVGTISVQVSVDHEANYIEIDTITSAQVTNVYAFPQIGPTLFTDFRVSGKTWTSGVAIIEIDPWTPPLAPMITGSNGTPQQAHAPDTFNTIQASAAGNTVVWTPATGKRFRLLKVWIQPQTDSTLPADADLFVELRDRSVPIGVTTSFYILKKFDGTEFPPFEQDLGPIGYLSTAVNNLLQVHLSAALSSGGFRVNVMGTEE
jgi:hypothetical protein